MTGQAFNPEFPDIAKAFEHLVGQTRALLVKTMKSSFSGFKVKDELI